ncbi:MAG: BMP family ABC transporter substrate-binding protein [Termitinemataceae bacterium]
MDTFRALVARSFAVLVFLCTATVLMAGGSADASSAGRPSGKSLVVFVPGVVSGSPIYEMLVAGVERAVQEQEGTQLKVVEGGFNQAEWESKITGLAAAQSYDLIISSNPAMPAICDAVSKKFPQQKFLLLDGELRGNPNVYTLRYNQREQGYVAGHIAALVVKEMYPGAQKKLGLIAGQEYPAMNTIILPGYLQGAQAVDPAFTVDFRIVGNWYDAAKGGDLAASIIKEGARVILPIAGGANQGVVQTATELGARVVWFDINGYSIKRGVVVGSAILRQDKAAYEKTKLYLNGKLPFGSAELVGIADGYVDFVDDDPDYLAAVPETVRKLQSAVVSQFRSGALALTEDGKLIRK